MYFSHLMAGLYVRTSGSKYSSLNFNCQHMGSDVGHCIEDAFSAFPIDVTSQDDHIPGQNHIGSMANNNFSSVKLRLIMGGTTIFPSESFPYVFSIKINNSMI